MVRNICFRPSQIQMDQIKNFMSIHQITEYSEGMRKIVDNWIKTRTELEQMRTYFDSLPKQTGPSLIELRECPMLARKFESISEEKMACARCSKRTPETYSSCPYNTGDKK